MNYLLKHGHLVVDGNREFLDGAMAISGERITEVFPRAAGSKAVLKIIRK